jgi:hypothetical protein
MLLKNTDKIFLCKYRLLSRNYCILIVRKLYLQAFLATQGFQKNERSKLYVRGVWVCVQRRRRLSARRDRAAHRMGRRAKRLDLPRMQSRQRPI